MSCLWAALTVIQNLLPFFAAVAQITRWKTSKTIRPKSPERRKHEGSPAKAQLFCHPTQQPHVSFFLGPGSDGGPQPRSWARIDLPSYCLSGLLGRMGGPRPKIWPPVHVWFFLGSWVGWVGRGKEAGLLLGSLHTSFLGSWVGWRCVGLPSCLLLSGLLGGVGGPRPHGSPTGAQLVCRDGPIRPSRTGAQLLAVDQKGNMKGPGAQLVCRDGPIRPSRTGAQLLAVDQKGNMKGPASLPRPTHATQEASWSQPSFLAAAHPSNPGAQKAKKKGS